MALPLASTLMLCWARARCTFTTEVPPALAHVTFLYLSTNKLTGCCRLPSSALFSPGWRLLPLLPWSWSVIQHLQVGLISCRCLKLPLCWALTWQWGLPAWHSWRYWWIPLDCWESRKGRPALLSNLLGPDYWFKRKRKGKGLLSTSFSSSSSVSSNNKGQGWIPLFFGEHYQVETLPHGKKLRWELTNVPCTQSSPLFNSAGPPWLISVMSPQPFQASNCNQEYWPHGLCYYELIFSSLWVTADEYLNVWSLIRFHVGTFSQ